MFLLLPKFGDGDLLLADLNLSCLGDVSRDLDLDLNLLDGSLISLGPNLLVILLSCGGEGLEYLLSSKGGLGSKYLSLSRLGVVESASILGSSSPSVVSSAVTSLSVSSLTTVWVMYSLDSTTENSFSTKFCVSD